MSVYADSSFFVSFYLQDRHAALVSQLMASRRDVFLTPFQRVELANVVYQHVFSGFISLDEARIVVAGCEQDRAGNLWREVDVPPMRYERAIDLAYRYVGTLGVRTLDTLHVAAHWS